MEKELEKLQEQGLELCREIEKFPASEHQTATAILASEIHSKIGVLYALALSQK